MAAHARAPRNTTAATSTGWRAEQLGEPLGGKQEEDWRKDRQQQGAEDAQPEPGAGTAYARDGAAEPELSR